MNFTEILNWINNNYEVVIAVTFAVELILRLFPTTKNISLVDWFKRIYDFILPNLQVKESQRIETSYVGKTDKSRRKRINFKQILNRHTNKVYREI